MRQVTKTDIQRAMKDGFTRKEAESGYSVFSSDYGNGALHIERIDVVNKFDSDEEAARQAEKDGHQIMWDLKFKDEEDRAYYLDTPHNRELLKDLIAE